MDKNFIDNYGNVAVETSSCTKCDHKPITLFTRKSLENAKWDTEYPIERTISDTAGLQNAVQFDHICCKFTNNTRAKKRIDGHDIPAQFEWSNIIEMDIDNDKNDTAESWITPEQFMNDETFANIKFYIVPSRNNMKIKHPGENSEQSARPRFHVIFPLSKTITDRAAYENIKSNIVKDYPEFDKSCVDATRFIYGIENPIVIPHDGELFVDELQWGFTKSTEETYIKNSDSKYMVEKKYKNITEALNYISPDDYDTWLKVGFGLYNENIECDIWDTWSQGSAKYKQGACANKWKTFRHNAEGKNITAGTIFKMAQENGYIVQISGSEIDQIIMQQCAQMKKAAESYVENANTSWNQHVAAKSIYCDTLPQYTDMCISVLKNYLKIYNNVGSSGKKVPEYYRWVAENNRYTITDDSVIEIMLADIRHAILDKIENDSEITAKAKKHMLDKLGSYMIKTNSIAREVSNSHDIISNADDNKYDAACVYATNDGIIDLRRPETLKNPIKTQFILCRNILDINLDYDKNIINQVMTKIVEPVFDNQECANSFIRRVSTAWLGKCSNRDNFCDIIKGVGANGKSKLIDLIIHSFLNFGSTAGPELIDDRLDNTFNALQKNKRLLGISECNNVVLGSKFKNVVDYSDIVINDKGVSKYVVENNARVIAACNYTPKTSNEVAHGRRLAIFPSTSKIYNVTIAKQIGIIKNTNDEKALIAQISEYGKFYADINTNHLKDITAWLLHLAAEEYTNNLPSIDNLPQAVQDLCCEINDYSADPIQKVNNKFEILAGAQKIDFKQIYELYLDICDEESIEHRLVRAQLIKKLSEGYGWDIRRQHGTWYALNRVIKSDNTPTPEPEPTKTIKEQITDTKIMNQIKNTPTKNSANSSANSNELKKQYQDITMFTDEELEEDLKGIFE